MLPQKHSPITLTHEYFAALSVFLVVFSIVGDEDIVHLDHLKKILTLLKVNNVSTYAVEVHTHNLSTYSASSLEYDLYYNSNQSKQICIEINTQSYKTTI